MQSPATESVRLLSRVTLTMLALFAVPWLAGIHALAAPSDDTSPGLTKYQAYVAAYNQERAELARAATVPVEAPDFAQMVAQPRADNHVLVRFADTRTSPDALRSLGVTHSKSLGFVPGLHRMQVPAHISMAAMLEKLNARPDVAYAEPDYRTLTTLIPNEPNITGGEWWLNQIRAFAAWDVSTDATAIGPVAVFDTGVLATHPDLVDNMWVNPDEIANNGIDDDGNGYIDDIHGIQALFTTITHGTPVAGTICGQGNNAIGYVGSAWDCQIMDIESVESTNNTVAAVVVGLDYAISEGSRLSNHSWRLFTFSQALADAVTQAETQGHLMICAAGNEGNNIDVQNVNFPARLPNDNVITVAASTQSEARISYSSFGPVSVDLAAPTEFVTVAEPAGYGGFSGTSQASPVVAGAVALAWSQAPEWSYLEIRQHVLDHVRTSALWTGLTTTGGILDMQAMMENIDPDTDQDGIPNSTDPDDDNDGVLDEDDAFPRDPNESVDTDSDGIGNNADTDDDGDGVADVDDWAPLDPAEQFDTDNDGVGNNADADDDNDGTPDAQDACPLDPDETLDSDGDSVCDNSDAFPNDPTENSDADGDGVGDNADNDGDNDGLPDTVETIIGLTIFSDDFEASSGWITNPDGTDTATTGAWAIGEPAQTSSDQDGTPIQLGTTTSGVNALVTDPTGTDLGCCDIDGGVTSVRSPPIVIPQTVTAVNLTLNYNFAHTLNAEVVDFFRITVEGASDVVVLDLAGLPGQQRGGAWTAYGADLTAFAGQTITLHIAAADNGGGSLIEAAVDDVAIVVSAMPDQDNDGVDDLFDLDSDNDSIPDVIEAGLQDVNNDAKVDDVADQGTVTTPPDSDGDGLPDYLDLESSNPNNDGTAYDIQTGPFAGEDTNGDGTVNDLDANGGTDANGNGYDDVFETTMIDTDGDGVFDGVDNCSAVANSDQRDTNNDGYGNACDADLNNDCVVNVVDLGILRAVFFSADPDADFNGDGVVNVVDLGWMRLGFFMAPGPSATDSCSGS